MPSRFTLLTAIVVLTGITPTLSAEVSVLSEGDRQALIERLTELKEGAGTRAEQQLRSALVAYRAAVGSDEAAHDLYLKCVEKVRFEDEKKSAKDFRDWKRRHKDREDSPGFRRVLRHQLNWLLLTLEANVEAEKEEGEDMTGKALAALDSIIGDETIEGRQFNALEQDVTKTVFALAYGINPSESWPASPLRLEQIYQKEILPPLAAKHDIGTYRSAWAKWILQEAKLQEARSQSGEKGERSVAFERFLVEKRPQMLWELEKSVFAVGDEKGGALGMLKHLETYSSHKNEIKWTKEFFELLAPEEEDAEE